MEAPERIIAWAWETDRGHGEWDVKDTGGMPYVRYDLAQAPAPVRVEARKTFPLLGGGGAGVDWQLVQEHSGQARTNHGQTLEGLARRGGLSWCELYAVLHERRWQKMDNNDAMIACRALEARYLAALEAPAAGVVAELVEAAKMAKRWLDLDDDPEGPMLRRQEVFDALSAALALIDHNTTEG